MCDPVRFDTVTIDESLIERMKQAAMDSSKNAYCPYSNFPVGAAVLTEDGEMFAGCNVENASYGLSMCAERNAVFKAIANGSSKIVAVAIYTPTRTPSSPCGACRQVINEFGARAELFSFDNDGNVLKSRLTELLPEAFGPDNLK